MTDVNDRATLDQHVSENGLGARNPGGVARKTFILIATLWPLFQLYVASPLPFLFQVGLFDDSQQRSIHLAFALFLGFLAYPAYASAPRKHVPAYDWCLAILAASCSLYIVAYYQDVVERAGGVRTAAEMTVSLLGLALVLEITRRVLGVSLVVVTILFSAYVFVGPHLPELISHRGFSLNRYVEHMWLTSEGVFGLPLGVSNSFIFLFVLFGALLDKAGAGNFFIKLSFALLGHLRGGPAKAAIVSSGFTGLVSGSAIANVVTTGTFTIPLMKRIGFSSEKAAAVEVTSSINGQIMPPVMGAAAFLMTEFVGVTYREVVIHAFLPAVISYVGLYYIVHLEAVKANMPLLERAAASSLMGRIGGFLVGFGALAAVAGLTYTIATTLKAALGGLATPVAAILLAILYVFLLRVAARYPELEIDNPKRSLSIPELRPTLLAGLHYGLPIGVLVWTLMVERLSPGLSVSWAILVLIGVLVTQRPLLTYFRGRSGYGSEFGAGVRDLLDGLVAGSRNMIGVAVAMAAAGIIVGVVSLTGLGLLMTEIINAVAGDNVLILLVFTALMCVLLGMGLPTTANYIVVSSVMAHPLVTLAAQSGVEIPLFAVHLFVFYFGLISGVTPPVAVDAFAGAAVARADPMQTCLQAFHYSLRTAVLPFIFVLNPELLLLNIDSWWHAALVIVTATIAMLAFAAGTQGYFLVRSRVWESALLLVLGLSLMRPGFWLDRIIPPYQAGDPASLISIVEEAPPGASLRVVAEGEAFSGDAARRVIMLPLGPADAGGAERLYESAGMAIRMEDGEAIVDDVRFDSPAQRSGLSFDWRIVEIQRPNSRPAKEWIYVPAYLLLGLLALLQWQRRRKNASRDP